MADELFIRKKGIRDAAHATKDKRAQALMQMQMTADLHEEVSEQHKLSLIRGDVINQVIEDSFQSAKEDVTIAWR